jgi:hypothetical protein
MERGGQITAQARLGAGEAPVHGSERAGEFGGCLRVTKEDETASAPAGQVSGVEGEVGQIITARSVADLAGGQVKGVTAGALLPDLGSHFRFGSAESCAHWVRDRGVRLVIGGSDDIKGFGGVAEIEQDICLLACCEREEAFVSGFAGGGGGVLEVIPGGGQAAHVDGLPPSQGSGVGENACELLAAARQQ